MIRKFTFLGLFLVLFLSSCDSEYDVFEEKVARFGNDKTISVSEWGELKSDIHLFEKDRSFRKFFSDEKFDENKLNVFLEKFGYAVESKADANSSKNTFINVYIENSGSMNGYINGNTEFKAAIQDLLVLLKYQYDEKNINLFFINSQIHPTALNNDLTGFASSLNTKNFKVGNTAVSDLNNVFKQVLHKTKKDTMSILVSDCIYSIHGNKTQELLSNEKSLTKDAFLTKSKENLNLSTTIVKLNSHFNGNYWDMNNKKTLLKNELRPYYITIIGDEKAMDNFNSNIELTAEKVNGYQNKYVLRSQPKKTKVFYSLINTTFDKGSYKVSRDENSTGGIHSIEDIKIDSRNGDDFIFSIAVDFSSVPTEADYITDISNYNATGYKILKIVPFDNKSVKPNSLNSVKRINAHPTHIITVQSPKNDYSDFVLKLAKNAPEWIANTNIEDDTNVEANIGKTFGFKYLAEGISEAYEIATKSNTYAELPIKIKK